jgi:hypothetical protein
MNAMTNPASTETSTITCVMCAARGVAVALVGPHPACQGCVTQYKKDPILSIGIYPIPPGYDPAKGMSMEEIEAYAASLNATLAEQPAEVDISPYVDNYVPETYEPTEAEIEASDRAFMASMEAQFHEKTKADLRKAIEVIRKVRDQLRACTTDPLIAMEDAIDDLDEAHRELEPGDYLNDE